MVSRAHPDEAASIRLPGGRRLAYTAIGPPDGRAVLYQHGMIGSPRWRTPAVEAAVAALGVRFVAVHRPGFSGSDEQPRRTVGGFARDVEALVDALAIARFAVAGVSAGAPYALACAWRMPERVTGVVAASPLTPRWGTGGSFGLRYALPHVGLRAPLLCDAGLRAAGASSVAAAPAIAADYHACRRPWGFEPSEVAAPVRLWHGALDRLVPLAHALRLAAALPTCAAHVEPGAGHFFFGKRVADIVGSLP